MSSDAAVDRTGATLPTVVRTVAEVRAHLDAERCRGRTVGFVPTMGALHEGHASLAQRAAADCDVVVASVFVNPLQFGAGEDFEAYPRTLDADLAVAGAAGVDVVFAPSAAEMYPRAVVTAVHVAGVSEGLEGAHRPTHFDGMATVVAKLFSIVGPCRAYFGAKDFQQLAVVRRMVGDLSLPVEVVACPTVRAADGLALSSRNAYLDADQRAAAVALPRALRAGADLITAGETDADVVRAAMAEVVSAEPLVAAVDYLEVCDPVSLVPSASPLTGELRLLGAVRIGSTRLIDNVGAVADGPRTGGGDR